MILGNIQAGRASPHLFATDTTATNSIPKRTSIFYSYGGQRICRTMFMFLHGVGHSRLENLIKHYASEGISNRVHKNAQRRPHNQTSFEVTTRVKEFIELFADNHALPLPGRLPSYKDYRVMLLPSDMTKVFVYNHYIATCEKENFTEGKMSRWTFQRIWNNVCPYVSVMKPATDLCFDCQQNASLVMRSANLSEDIKSQRLQDAQKHLATARLQRHHYNDQCELARKALDSAQSNSTPTPTIYSPVKEEKEQQ